MSSSVETKQEVQQPIDSIVYSTFVSKFNEEYSEVLSENQKNLLGRYISSFADNGVELKVYLNEEIGRLKEGLDQARHANTNAPNAELKEKIDRIYTILDETKNREIDTETLELVLNTQGLLEEISNHDD